MHHLASRQINPNDVYIYVRNKKSDRVEIVTTSLATTITCLFDFAYQQRGGGGRDGTFFV
jgi:hypothetical protein